MDVKIRINNLTTYYGIHKILDDINLEIKKNRITTIIGPSGCGKTTLLMTLSGLVGKTPNFSMEGKIAYEEEVFSGENIDALIGRFGFVFQQPLAFPISIEKNMMFATKYLGKTKSECMEIAIEKLTEVNLWDEVKDKLKMKANKLSGGQQQRLCLARALTMYPDVLLLDEPCSALDIKNTTIIEQMLLKMKKDYTIIFVTHNLSQARRISDEVIFINEGKLIEQGNMVDFFRNPREQDTKNYISGEFG
ncbi:MAG TPA: ATP-binding cassette domain-containing protein [Anaerovoracaceae bacterium]|nr:ATP-binding cassette domain-containing protein [Anaerovoracaceae bacterium]